MDEEQISELLECSVCMEQFNQSCKVLPCQHTFCRRCLDEIVSRKFQLRCPECRMLITIPVAKLPTNIFVMRILELKNQRLNKSSNSLNGAKVQSSHANSSGLGSSPSHGLGYSPSHHFRDGCSIQAGHHLRQNQPFAKALYSYESTEKEDLTFKKGDVIVLRRQVDENWFMGDLGGKTGFFPTNFVQVVIPLPQVPQSIALYDFELEDESEKDCLSFKKDELISVIRKVDENWLEGRLGDKIGIFPISFVELNDAARMLINASKSNHATGSTATSVTHSLPVASSPPLLTMPLSTTAATTTTSTTCVTINTSSLVPFPETISLPSSPSTTVSPSRTPPLLSTLSSPYNLSPQNKRHSYASSSTCSSPIPPDSTQLRHSMDVTLCPNSFTAPVSIATITTTAHSNLSIAPSVTAYALEPPSSSVIPAADSQRNNSSPSSPTPVAESNAEMQASVSVSSAGGTNHSSSIAIPIYVALYNYHPQKDDELELHKGEHYTVVEKCQDGWFKGSHMKTGQAGVFPGNYVSMNRHSSAFKPMNPNVLNIRAKGPSGLASHPSSNSSPSSTLSHSSGNGQQPESGVDSSVTSGPPPLMPRAAKMPGSKSRQASSHLMALALRSISNPGTSSPCSSISSSAPISSSFPNTSPSSLMLESSSLSGGFSKVKLPSSHRGPTVFTSPHRNKTWTSSQQQQQQSLSATTITPPNVVMSSSHDMSNSMLQSISKEKDKKKKNKDEKKKGGFLNLFKEKTSKFTSSSTDNESQSSPVVNLDTISHTRSGSFPAEISCSSSGHYRGGGSGPTIEHRKALSLDSTVIPPVPDKPRARSQFRNKYCCVVPFPSQMNDELGLEVGDIVYVIRTREDGWYKGTHARTGKTGMFPGCFVEKCD